MHTIPAPSDNVAAIGFVNKPGQARGLTILDSHVDVLASNANTGGRAFIIIESSQPGAGPPLHKHTNEDEFFYILEGTYMFLIDGKQVTATVGTSLLAPAGSIHAFANMGQGVGRMMVMTLPRNSQTPSTFEKAFEETHAACMVNDASPERITNIFEPAGVSFLGPPLAAMGLLANKTP